LVWSISGGAEYRSYLGNLIHHHWHTIEPDVSILVVALDQETADVVCRLEYDAVYWDAPAQSYSRVTDAKMQVAVEWVDRKIDALFVEMDTTVSTRSTTIKRQSRMGRTWQESLENKHWSL
jgi:hypothetical protein